jgi:hypothetical protein
MTLWRIVSPHSGTTAPPPEDPWSGSYLLTPNFSPSSGTISNPRVYEGRRFVRASTVYYSPVSSPSGTAVVSLTSAYHDIIFRNCIFDPGYAGYLNGWNCVTINSYNHNIDRIWFEDCLFKGIYDAQGYSLNRMGFECTERGSTATTNYQDIRLVRCAVEVQGSEAISFDGRPTPANCRVEDVVCYGSGNNRVRNSTDTGYLFPWGQSFEINGPTAFTVNNLEVWCGRGALGNFSGNGSTDNNWVFSDCAFHADWVHSQQKMAQGSTSQVWTMAGVCGTEWYRTLNHAVSPPGSYNAYIHQSSDNNSFSNMTWRRTGGTPYCYVSSDSTGNVGLP